MIPARTAASDLSNATIRRAGGTGMTVDQTTAMNMYCAPSQKRHPMTIAKYRPHSSFTNPFGELVSEFLNRDIGQILGHNDDRRSLPGVNILEREKEFELQLQAPGYAKEDLKISMDNDVLAIIAEPKKMELKENERWTRREFVTNGFRRSFRLPETVNVEGIVAEFTTGVLVVRIPKAEANQPKAREINIG